MPTTTKVRRPQTQQRQAKRDVSRQIVATRMSNMIGQIRGVHNQVLTEQQLHGVVCIAEGQITVTSREEALQLIEAHGGKLTIARAGSDLRLFEELQQSGQIEVVHEDDVTITYGLS